MSPVAARPARGHSARGGPACIRADTPSTRKIPATARSTTSGCGRRLMDVPHRRRPRDKSDRRRYTPRYTEIQAVPYRVPSRLEGRNGAETCRRARLAVTASRHSCVGGWARVTGSRGMARRRFSRRRRSACVQPCACDVRADQRGRFVRCDCETQRPRGPLNAAATPAAADSSPPQHCTVPNRGCAYRAASRVGHSRASMRPRGTSLPGTLNLCRSADDSRAARQHPDRHQCLAIS